MIKRWTIHLELHRGYWPKFYIRPQALAGERHVDGGVPGTLVLCNFCSGQGLLHRPDDFAGTWPEPAPITNAPPVMKIYVKPGEFEGAKVGETMWRYDRNYVIRTIEYNIDGWPSWPSAFILDRKDEDPHIPPKSNHTSPPDINLNAPLPPGPHTWQGNSCLECEADISWCPYPPTKDEDPNIPPKSNHTSLPAIDFNLEADAIRDIPDEFLTSPETLVPDYELGRMHYKRGDVLFTRRTEYVVDGIYDQKLHLVRKDVWDKRDMNNVVRSLRPGEIRIEIDDEVLRRPGDEIQVDGIIYRVTYVGSNFVYGKKNLIDPDNYYEQKRDW